MNTLVIVIPKALAKLVPLVDRSKTPALLVIVALSIKRVSTSRTNKSLATFTARPLSINCSPNPDVTSASSARLNKSGASFVAETFIVLTLDILPRHPDL